MPELAYDHQQYLNNLTATQAQIPQTEVGGEIEKLTTQCTVLAKQIDQLEQRLGPVLTVPGAQAVGATSAPEPVLVPLAQMLHERVKHLSQLSDQLQSIISRIAV